MQIDPHLLNVLLAVILGGMIGLDRQKKHQAAGLRTHMLVCVASTVLITSAISYFGEGRTEIAPIAQAIMTGIGFLGAGAIISKNAHVHGLTTAASIWCVAALGIIIGFGEYLMATIVAVFITLLLTHKSIDRILAG